MTQLRTTPNCRGSSKTRSLWTSTRSRESTKTSRTRKMIIRSSLASRKRVPKNKLSSTSCTCWYARESAASTNSKCSATCSRACRSSRNSCLPLSWNYHQSRSSPWASTSTSMRSTAFKCSSTCVRPLLPSSCTPNSCYPNTASIQSRPSPHYATKYKSTRLMMRSTKCWSTASTWSRKYTNSTQFCPWASASKQMSWRAGAWPLEKWSWPIGKLCSSTKSAEWRRATPLISCTSIETSCRSATLDKAKAYKANNASKCVTILWETPNYHATSIDCIYYRLCPSICHHLSATWSTTSIVSSTSTRHWSQWLWSSGRAWRKRRSSKLASIRNWASGTPIISLFLGSQSNISKRKSIRYWRSMSKNWECRSVSSMLTIATKAYASPCKSLEKTTKWQKRPSQCSSKMLLISCSKMRSKMWAATKVWYKKYLRHSLKLSNNTTTINPNCS